VKHIFQIPIFMLMLWASGVGYAAHSVVYHSPEKETVSATRLLLTKNPALPVARISADEVRLALAERDLEGFDDAWEFVRTNPRGTDTWEVIILSVNNVGGSTQFARDLKTLEKVAEYLDPANVNKLNAIGGRTGLESFIFRNTDLLCLTCTGGHPVFAGRNMDEMIENFVEVGYYFRNNPDLWSKLQSGASHPFPAMREGSQHTLKTIKENPSKYAPEKIESFDLRFEELPADIDLCPSCRFNIRFKDEYIGGNTPKLAEFKSYAFSTWANIKNSPKFLQQFERYLQDISEISELQYIYNGAKASETPVKIAFRELFLAKKVEIFDAMKPELKASLFGQVPSFQFQFFEEMIENINSDLYKFINTL